MQRQDHGVPFLHLSNLLEDVRKRKQLALQDGQVLRRFQEALENPKSIAWMPLALPLGWVTVMNGSRGFYEESGPDAPFALVLSLQRAASGTNLTAASHVLFVHPMSLGFALAELLFCPVRTSLPQTHILSVLYGYISLRTEGQPSPGTPRASRLPPPTSVRRWVASGGSASPLTRGIVCSG